MSSGSSDLKYRRKSYLLSISIALNISLALIVLGLSLYVSTAKLKLDWRSLRQGDRPDTEYQLSTELPYKVSPSDAIELVYDDDYDDRIERWLIFGWVGTPREYLLEMTDTDSDGEMDTRLMKFSSTNGGCACRELDLNQDGKIDLRSFALTDAKTPELGFEYLDFDFDGLVDQIRGGNQRNYLLHDGALREIISEEERDTEMHFVIRLNGNQTREVVIQLREE